MRKLPLTSVGFIAVALFTVKSAPGADQTASPMADNPFFTAESAALPLPAVRPDHGLRTTRPPFERGMADQLKEDDAIANNPRSRPSITRSSPWSGRGRILDRVSNVFSNLKDLEGDATLAALDKEMAPKLAAESDEIYLNPKLWARVKELYDARSTLGLDPESLRLLERYRRDFVRAGANLSDADKTRLKALNAEAATLEATFSQNVLNEKNAAAVVVPDKAELAGLSDAEIATPADAAKARASRESTSSRSSTRPASRLDALARPTGRSASEIMEESLGRGSHGGPYDNQATCGGDGQEPRRARRPPRLPQLCGLPGRNRDGPHGRRDRQSPFPAGSAPRSPSAKREAATCRRSSTRSTGASSSRPGTGISIPRRSGRRATPWTRTS
jgi:peptidyl-dipeptidase Dcp